jgi:hypothetical protein
MLVNRNDRLIIAFLFSHRGKAQLAQLLSTLQSWSMNSNKPWQLSLEGLLAILDVELISAHL